MKRLHDYLEYDLINVITTDGNIFEGVPVDVNYADESESGEDEIIIFVEDGKGYCFSQHEIKEISVM